MYSVQCTLRKKLDEPTPDQPVSPLWLTRFASPPQPPKETARNLRDLVGAPTHQTKTGTKLKAVAVENPHIDTQLWLSQARAANNGNAVTWFTNHVLRTTPQTETRKHMRLTATLDKQWHQLPGYLEHLTRTHMNTINTLYSQTQAEEQANRHIRCLDNAYKQVCNVKQQYNHLVRQRHETQLKVTHLQTTYLVLQVFIRETYDQAKLTAMMTYNNAKSY